MEKLLWKCILLFHTKEITACFYLLLTWYRFSFERFTGNLIFNQATQCEVSVLAHKSSRYVQVCGLEENTNAKESNTVSSLEKVNNFWDVSGCQSDWRWNCVCDLRAQALRSVGVCHVFHTTASAGPLLAQLSSNTLLTRALAHASPCPLRIQVS